MNAALGAVKAPVYTDLTDCQDCYKFYCGRCVVNCPAHAKHYRNDVEKVKLLLADERKTVATVQQITFLLGENAAESEVILNSIIESYTAGKEDA